MEVLLINDERNKLDAKYYIGPFPKTAVHTNGNVTIQHGHMFQHVNIHCIKLYHCHKFQEGEECCICFTRLAKYHHLLLYGLQQFILPSYPKN